MHYFFTLAIAIVIYLPLSSQVTRQTTNNNNGWFMYFGDHKLSEKWGVHLEAQWRRNEFILKPQQLLLRIGINYHFNTTAFATLGYCFVDTYPYGAFAVKTTFPEHRLWEQVQIKNQVGHFEIVTRFRLEQRWLDLPVLVDGKYEPGPSVYQNRFRVLSRFSIPFKGQTITDKSLYATVYDELMVSFGKNVGYNIFDQNRAYIALGYKIPKVGRLEIGYMNQIILKSDGVKVENNHTLQVGLISNIDFYKKKTS